MISLLLVDDNDMLRKAIAHILACDPEIQLVAEAVSFADTMRLTHDLQPQVVLMDLHLRDQKAVTPSQVKSSLAGSQLLAMSIWDDDETKTLAEIFGAVTLLDKTNLATELIPAIKLYGTEKKEPATRLPA